MKYVPPYGVSDPNASYINGDPSQGLKGSIPPAACFENPQREIVNLINFSKFVPSDADLNQVTESVRSQAVNFCRDTGSANTLSVTLNPPLQAYTPGLLLRVLIHDTNTTQTTIDAGCGRVNVLRSSGASLAAGDLVSGGLYDMAYDGTNFQLVNFLGTGTVGDVNNYYINIPYAVDSSTTPNIVTANFTPAITHLAAGQPILVKIANNNSAASKINVNTLSPVTLKAVDEGDLLPDDIVAGGVYLMVHDGTNFVLAPSNIITSQATFNIPSTQFNTVAALLAAIQRKIIGPSGHVTIQLATGIFPPITLTHPSTSSISIKGTMIGAKPVGANFAQSGSSAGARAGDASANLAMLRNRFGTEIQVPHSGGIGVHATYGTFPTVQDLLITTGNSTATGAQTYGIYNEAASCTNVSVWGCHAGFFSDAMGNMVLYGCFASACYFGFDSGSGGVIGTGPTGSQGNGAYGCDHTGFITQGYANMQLNTTQSRCNGYFGYFCSDNSSILGYSVDGINNGSLDAYCANEAHMNLVGINIQWFSPLQNTIGNNNSMILTS